MPCSHCSAGGLGVFLFGSVAGHRPHGHRRPVELEVVVEPLPHEQRAQSPAQERVVRGLFKAQLSAIIEECGKFARQPLTECADRSRLLRFQGHVAAALPRARREALPRQAAQAEVDQHVADRLQVVAPALLNPRMPIHAGISDGTNQALAVRVPNVFEALQIAKRLREAEVDEMNLIRFLAQANQKIVRLDVAVHKPLGMNIF
mmetsp:Transcript_55545/g.160953  ORF Transcript_55545/g.160953 Transcript_55545/m.160953 type:complete len:204 (+) Transcript_55545:88-699(+)